MLFSCREASLRKARSTHIEEGVRGRRSRLSYSRFLATKKRGLMQGLTPNGLSRKSYRLNLDKHRRALVHRAESRVRHLRARCSTSSEKSEVSQTRA